MTDAPRPPETPLRRPTPVYLPQGMPLHALHEMEACGLGPGAQVLAQVLASVQRWVLALSREEDEMEAVRPAMAPEHRLHLGAVEDAVQLLGDVLAGWAEDGLREQDRRQAHDACARIARWAEQTMRAQQTALAFAQLASDLRPGDPRASYEVGRLASLVAAHPEAMTWLQYARQQAEEAEDRETDSLACFALGRLTAEGGHAEHALRWYRAAAAAARASKGPLARLLLGDTHFERCLLYLRGQVWDRAVVAASHAVHAYGAEHPRIHRLALELAWIWVDEQGHAFDALLLLHALEDQVRDAELHLLVRACTARAAAMEEEVTLCEAAWNGAFRSMADPATRRVQPLALLQLTYAAATLGQWPRAEVAARAALARAQAETLSGPWQETAVRLATVLADAGGDAPAEEVLHELFPDLRRKAGGNTLREEQERWHEELVRLLLTALLPRTDGGPAGPVTRLLAGAR